MTSTMLLPAATDTASNRQSSIQRLLELGLDDKGVCANSPVEQAIQAQTAVNLSFLFVVFNTAWMARLNTSVQWTSLCRTHSRGRQVL